MKMRAVPLGQSGLVLGGSEPLACVPIVAADIAATLGLAATIRAHDPVPDLVELRADYLAPLSPADLTATLRQLREALGAQMPILFTNRSSAEGGAGHWPEDERLASFIAAIDSGAVALIDIERFAVPAALREQIAARAAQQDIGVIISAHNFSATPDYDGLLGLFNALVRSGANIGKLAVMAQSPDDALRLLRTSAQWAKKTPIPLIIIAMGPVGTITRLAGPFFGSALSYATIGPPSAPGQVPLTLLRDYWRVAGLRR
ncbi:MAG TPA: type I 3-dehydroquinate dehydratase [Ktedonobacterales bacterium]|nr:type I 3-dehydroquinate dehydratase [Ktedonobacterales bacterium]